MEAITSLAFFFDGWPNVAGTDNGECNIGKASGKIFLLEMDGLFFLSGLCYLAIGDGQSHLKDKILVFSSSDSPKLLQ